jgi:hypothetical protein
MKPSGGGASRRANDASLLLLPSDPSRQRLDDARTCSLDPSTLDSSLSRQQPDTKRTTLPRMSSSRAAKLAELKAARSGSSSRASQWKASSASSAAVYDEVSEADYDALVRKRLEQDDFIEDDDGGGYADDGREDWSGDDERRAADDSEEEHDREDRKSTFRPPNCVSTASGPTGLPLLGWRGPAQRVSLHNS